MKNFLKVKAIFTIMILAVTLSGCGGSGGSDVLATTEELTGMVTNRGIYFSPLLPSEEDIPLVNESIVLDADEEDVTINTDNAGKFRLRLRKRNGNCNTSGELNASGGQKRRYGGNGKFGDGERIMWNFVDNDGDGICDNTLEVSLN